MIIFRWVCYLETRQSTVIMMYLFQVTQGAVVTDTVT